MSEKPPKLATNKPDESNKPGTGSEPQPHEFPDPFPEDEVIKNENEMFYPEDNIPGESHK